MNCSVFAYCLILLYFNLFTGVPRETEKDKDLADFDIFDDPESPFSTFNFQYSNEAYTRLHDLMEFNTLNNLEVSSAPVVSLLDVPDIKQQETVMMSAVRFAVSGRD